MKLDVRGLEGRPAREDYQSVFRCRATDGDLRYWASEFLTSAIDDQMENDEMISKQ